MEHVEKTIGSTPAGETILISTFLFDRRLVVDELIEASKRGVSVQVIMDSAIESGQSRRLARRLNADNTKPPLTGAARGGPDRSFTYMCQGSCRGGGGNMHTKFYAFSKAGTSRNVVMISSANLNAGGALTGYNDLFTMANKPATYQKFAGIHQEMVDDSPGDADRYTTVREGRFENRFFPMRDATKTTDPTMRDLSRVRCHGSNGRTAITISMFYWAGERGLYIADRLLKLEREGCVVSVMYGAPSNAVAAVLRHAAHQGRITLYDSRVHTDDDGEVDIRVHSKYLLISGRYAGSSSARQVFTGSQNWVGGSLTKGDEVMLGIEGAPAYASYLRNWNDVRRTGARQIGG